MKSQYQCEYCDTRYGQMLPVAQPTIFGEPMPIDEEEKRQKLEELKTKIEQVRERLEEARMLKTQTQQAQDFNEILVASKRASRWGFLSK